MTIYLSPREAAKAAGVTSRRILYLCKRHQLEGAYKDGACRWHIPIAALSGRIGKALLPLSQGVMGHDETGKQISIAITQP